MFAVLSIYGLSLSNLEGDSDARGRGRARDRASRSRRPSLTRRAAGGPRLAAARRCARGRPRGHRRRARPGDAQAEERLAAIDVVSRRPPENGHRGGARPAGRGSITGLKKFNENPGLALYKLQSNGYKFSWLLIPLSVPFVWLLFFWTRRLPFLRPYRLRHLFARLHVRCSASLLTILGFAGVAVGDPRAGGPVHPADPHLPPAEAGLLAALGERAAAHLPAGQFLLRSPPACSSCFCSGSARWAEIGPRNSTASCGRCGNAAQPFEREVDHDAVIHPVSRV